MKIRLQDELLLINVTAILLILIIAFFPTGIPLRVILGLPLLLFFPGYTLGAAVFPAKNALDNILRVALSFATSVVVVPTIGLILVYTPWGLSLYPILVSLTIFIVVTSLVAWYRRQRQPPAKRFTVSLNLTLPWQGQSSTGKVLSIILVLTVLGAVGTTIYTIVTPGAPERFTEFYILGLDGQATDYPREVKLGEQARVIAGIINQEHETVTYRLQIQVNGVNKSTVGPIELANDEKWEGIVSFIPDRGGDNQRVDFLLYKDEGNEPYRRTRLQIDVRF